MYCIQQVLFGDSCDRLWFVVCVDIVGVDVCCQCGIIEVFIFYRFFFSVLFVRYVVDNCGLSGWS